MGHTAEGPVVSARGQLMQTHLSDGGKDEWLTPPSIIEEFGPFDLDPCAAIGQPWATAAEQYTVEQDGLSLPWHGAVWCNPPYKQWPAWLAKLAEHGDGIAMIFTRLDTRAFRSLVWEQADGALFLYRRQTFHHADGRLAANNGGAPSVLIAYGADCAGRLRHSDTGFYVPLGAAA